MTNRIDRKWCGGGDDNSDRDRDGDPDGDGDCGGDDHDVLRDCDSGVPKPTFMTGGLVPGLGGGPGH